jgi:hypothetical protein
MLWRGNLQIQNIQQSNILIVASAYKAVPIRYSTVFPVAFAAKKPVSSSSDEWIISDSPFSSWHAIIFPHNPFHGLEIIQIFRSGHLQTQFIHFFPFISII